MHLQLLIPGLIWPEAMASLPPLPSFELMYARSRRSKPAAPDAQQWLFAMHDVVRPGTPVAYDAGAYEAGAHGAVADGAPQQTRDWPAAAFARLGDGGAPDDACWISADPVHLRLQRDTLLLADASLFAITRNEADALVASLNAHFAADGFAVQAPHPERWYARLAASPELVTTPLALAAGQSVDPQLPRGADAAAWHARMNEAQMLLHDHPVNEAREARGQMPVNSLWFWGAGALPAPGSGDHGDDADEDDGDDKPRQPFSRVWAADPLALGLARWSGAVAQPLPASAAALLAAAPPEGVGLAVLGGLEAARAYGDIGAWETRLRELESVWLMPLVAALREQRIGMLSVHGFGGPTDEKAFSLEAVQHDLKRFWRRPKPLAKLLA